VCGNVTNVRDKEQLFILMSSEAKQYGSEGILAPLVADAFDCHGDRVGGGSDGSGSATLNVDSVRTVKFLGSSVASSTLLEGYVAVRGLETVSVPVPPTPSDLYLCWVEAQFHRSQGHGSHERRKISKLQPHGRKEHVGYYREHCLGVKVVVTGGNVSDMALHFAIATTHAVEGQ
jgi:hypothetical protein